MFWANKPVNIVFGYFGLNGTFLDQKSEVLKKSKESKFSQLVSPFFLPDSFLMHKDKMDCILFGTGPRLALSTSFSVTIDGKVLNRASENKYLGVVPDPLLTWNAHVDYLAGNRVRQRVALLGPVMKNINVYMTGTVYTSVVLPILDYCDAECSYFATSGVLTLRGWRNCKARRGARYVFGEQRKRANFPGLRSSG